MYQYVPIFWSIYVLIILIGINIDENIGTYWYINEPKKRLYWYISLSIVVYLLKFVACVIKNQITHAVILIANHPRSNNNLLITNGNK